uniref:Uncharacterized protein n=1 Tax=Micrurus carvalhoi TaxID=3147026 RepID=A0A2H6NDM5_9SAUR
MLKFWAILRLHDTSFHRKYYEIIPSGTSSLREQTAEYFYTAMEVYRKWLINFKRKMIVPLSPKTVSFKELKRKRSCMDFCSFGVNITKKCVTCTIGLTHLI